MPYISNEDATKIAEEGFTETSKLGDLAFSLWSVLTAWHSGTNKNESYTNFAEVIGVLETIKLEYSRKYLFPYEDQKIEENGDLDIFDYAAQEAFLAVEREAKEEIKENVFQFGIRTTKNDKSNGSSTEEDS